jgi:ABC-type transport system substrate-binding protein
VLYTCDRLNCSAAAEIIKQDLAAIGLRLVVKTFAVSALYSTYKVPDATFDMGFVWWSADYPDPDDFLNLLLETGSLLPTFRDPHVRAELAAASRLSGSIDT